MGGFSLFSLCGSDQGSGFDAPPGGTALQRGEWITDGRQEEVRYFSMQEGRDVRKDHTRGKSQTAARQGFNI